MTGRLLTRISAAVAVALACTPTQPCACPPARSAFVVYGRVLRADGAPGAGANLRFDASSPSRETPCDFTRFSETLEPSSLTDAAGSFRVRLYSGSQPGVRCLRVAAFQGAPGATDSVRLGGLLVEFRSERLALDSLGLELTLP